MRAFVFTLFASLAATGCGAPRADPLDGDIAAVVQKGVANGDASFDHHVWDRLVQTYASEGGQRFDYAGLASERDAFENYLADLAAVDLSALRASEIQALLINAYNAYTIKSILDRVTPEGNYEIESIRDINNVFEREDHDVGGFTLSLDNIEHNILRPMFRDPRFHFAVNCASISCPPLPTRAFTGERLDEQLDSVTRTTLRNPDYVATENRALVVTRIMDWYGGDFINPEYRGSQPSLAAFIGKYATSEIAELISARGGEVDIVFRDYDWRLNRKEP